MISPGTDTTIPIGIYRSAAPDIGPVQVYEKFLGMPSGTTVSYVLAFMADRPKWSEFEQGVLQATTNGPAGSHSAMEWSSLLGPRTLLLSVPACVNNTSWASEAAGLNDIHWQLLARNLTGAGLGNCVLRIAREFNGGWYPWTVSPGNVADHRAAWPHIVSVMKGAGFTGSFMWNPTLGQGTFGPNAGADSAYPGNSSVDVIGLDMYDWGYPARTDTEPRATAQQQAMWNSFRDQWDGLTGWQSFAAARGKQLAYPEWGLNLWKSGGNYIGGGDNALFVQEAAAWMKYSRPFMHAFWEDAGVGVSDPDAHPGRLLEVPRARAAFLNEFGYG